MPDFSQRSYQKELLDGDDIPFADIRRNMQELETINTRLGGHAITICGLKALSGKKTEELSICEIGCGGGDNLKAIHKWCLQNGIRVKLLGIDINNDCISYARENCAAIAVIEFMVSDYELVTFDSEKPSIIFSSLFTHHLDDRQFGKMLKWSFENSTSGFFINDLHRHFLAYYSIKLLTYFFSNSYLVKNDAPLSVKRGFKKKEMIAYLTKAGIKDYAIKWKWAFRWLVIVKH